MSDIEPDDVFGNNTIPRPLRQRQVTNKYSPPYPLRGARVPNSEMLQYNQNAPLRRGTDVYSSDALQGHTYLHREAFSSKNFGNKVQFDKSTGDG